MRAAYGGLQGDVAMLRRFSLLWTARHASNWLFLSLMQADECCSTLRLHRPHPDLYLLRTGPDAALTKEWHQMGEVLKVRQRRQLS